MIDARKIKEEVPMRDLLPRLGIDVPQGRRKFSMCCPFHDDKTPSAWVILESDREGRFVCFTCDIRLDVIAFVMQFNLCSFQEAREWIIREFTLTDDPLEDMWKRFQRGQRGEQRRDVGEVTVAYLNLFHGAWWHLRDEYPERDGDLREMRQVWMAGFDSERPDVWYRQAMEDLERWEMFLEHGE